MIRCIFSKNSFRILGHANYDVKGKDIVCASVSILSQSTILGLVDILKLDCDTCKVSGNLQCYIKEPTKESEVLMDTFRYTIKMLANQYPKYISIEEELIQ